MLVTGDHRALGEELHCIIVFCDQVPEGSSVREEWVASVRSPGDTDYWVGSKAARADHFMAAGVCTRTAVYSHL